MSRYKAYPEYRDSEVEWLGKIPRQWGITHVKFIAELTPKKPIIEKSLECSFIPMEKLKTDSITLDETRVVGDVYDGYTYFQDGDILMAKVTPCFENKNIAVAKNLVNSVGFGSSEIYVIRTRKGVSNRYWFYRLQEDSFMDIATAAMTGAGGLKRVPSDVVSNFTAALPSFLEQEKIADFLDHETAKIDTLIAKQQELIKLLKEKRQAVISHAVTKGLNPNAPMRDSGVEWLGDVPAHWVRTRLKYLKSKEANAFVDGPFGSNLKSEHFIDEGEIYVIESNFATTGEIEPANLKKISRAHFETVKRSATKEGDIIIAKIGARYGSSAILPKLDRESLVSGNSLKLTVDVELLDIEYANEVLRFLKLSEAMDDGVNVTAQPALSLGGLNNLPFLRVPMIEQKEIVEYVNEQKRCFDRLVDNAERLIELAKERRTALISAAVTGKIDVRDWQPPVSEAQAA